MLQFILGSKECGKTTDIAEKISSLIADDKEILVIVPEQFTFEYERTLYLKLGAGDFNKVCVKSFKRLAAQILEESGETLKKYADNYTKSILISLAIKQVCDNDGLLYYSKQAKSIGFASMMLDCCSDLSQSGLEMQQLEHGAENLKGTLGEKFKDIINIYFTYKMLLAKHNLEDSMSAITQAAKSANSQMFFDGKYVFIDEFKSFTSDEKLMIQSMLSQDCSVFCALDTDDENSNLLYLYSVNRTFASLKQIAKNACAKIKISRLKTENTWQRRDIRHLTENIFQNRISGKTYSDNIVIADALNVYDECEYVCAEIWHLVHEQNYRFDEIAIVTRNAESYENVLDEYADIYGIPLFKALPKTPANTALSIFISTALDLSFGSFETEKLLYYAKTMLAGISHAEISELENFCYIWDIDKKLWLDEFTQNDELTKSAESTRKKLIEPLIRLKEKCKNTTGDAITKALYEHFCELNLQENLRILCDSYEQPTDDSDNHISLEYARELKLLWNVICDILDTFYTYLNGVEISPAEYRELFLCALSKADYTNAPQKLNCVSVSQIQLTRLNSPKIVFILGANEGFFPRNSVTPGLFSSTESAKLIENGIELAKTDKQIYSEECFAAFAAVSAPTEKLYITYPLLDKSNSSCTKAYTLDLIQGMFDNKITLCVSNLPQDYFAVTKHAAYRRYVMNFNRNCEFKYSCESALIQYEEYAEKINALKNSADRQEYALNDTDTITKLYGTNVQTSATKLETFCECPFKFFMNYGLKVRPLRKKAITANEKGSIVHFCLESIFKTHQKADFLALDREQIEQCVKKYLDEYTAENLGGDYRESEKFNYSMQLICENTCDIIENLQREFAQSNFYPCEFEYFMQKGYSVDISNIKSPKITLNGITDRIDLYVSDKGRFVRIVDYKTGGKDFSMADLLCGKNMQMFLYLFALIDSDKNYANCTPAGVLYYRAVEAMPSLDRTADEQMVINTQNACRKMIGVILNDNEIIDAMDKDCGTFLPLKRTKKGDIDKRYTKNLLDSKQFEMLDRYCSDTIKRCGKRILSGDIAAIPLKSACDYCDYKSACTNYPLEKIKVLSQDSETLVEKLKSGEYNYGDSFDIISDVPREKGDDDERLD